MARRQTQDDSHSHFFLLLRSLSFFCTGASRLNRCFAAAAFLLARCVPSSSLALHRIASLPLPCMLRLVASKSFFCCNSQAAFILQANHSRARYRSRLSLRMRMRCFEIQFAIEANPTHAQIEASNLKSESRAQAFWPTSTRAGWRDRGLQTAQPTVACARLRDSRCAVSGLTGRVFCGAEGKDCRAEASSGGACSGKLTASSLGVLNEKE